MANTTDVKIILDGPRNAKVRVSGILDTANLTSTVLITTALFTNNDVRMGPLTGFRVNFAKFAVSGSTSLVAEWEATTPQLIATFADANEVCWEPGLIPVSSAAGYTGSIALRTVNWVATVQTFTLTLDLIKLY